MSDVSIYRRQLLQAGFAPLPLSGKRPAFDKWSIHIQTNPQEIELWDKVYPFATNTGALTRLMPTIDIDILDEAAAEAIEQLARERFEERGFILVRVGKAPKRAIPLRTNVPFKKRQTSLKTSAGTSDQKIEILCDGQQVVVGGTHPDTRQPYRWHGSELSAIELTDLPYCSEQDADAFLTAAETILVSQFGFSQIESPRENGHAIGDDQHADWPGLVSKILQGIELHDSLRDLAAAMSATAIPAAATTRVLRAIMLSSQTAHDDRWRDRLKEIDGLVRSAAKFAKEIETPTALGQLLYPYVTRIGSQIPTREWLHAKHYVRRYVVMTVAPGGYGKSSLLLCNAIEIITGRGLIGPAPQERCNVCYWNAEESEREEIERRVAALCIAHSIDPHDLEGKLHLGPKIATDQMRFARMVKGVLEPNTQLIDLVVQYITENHIGVLMLDPLISFHRLSEIDTVSLETLIKGIFEPVAIKTNCCIELSHHTRKSNNTGFGQAEITADDSRGAGAAAAACRSVRVLNRMSREDGEAAKISEETRKLYLRVSRDKTNMAPPSKARWIRLAGIDIHNEAGSRPSDNVQAAVAWNFPKPFDDVGVEDMHFMRAQVARQSYRTDPRSPEWVGRVLATHLALDHEEKADRKKIAAILKEWISTGVLAVEKRMDNNRKLKEFVIPGTWKDEQEEALQSVLI